MDTKDKFKGNIFKCTPFPDGPTLLINKNNNVTGIEIDKLSLKLNPFPNKPLQIKNKNRVLSIEDLNNHPMSLSKRWSVFNDFPEYKLSDSQSRFIITIKDGARLKSYVFPKFFANSEIAALVVYENKTGNPPFDIKMAVIKNRKLRIIIPRKPARNAKILMATQILGHVQEAANIAKWAYENNTLKNKWEFALPPTNRTILTKRALKEKGIKIENIIHDWSYAGGKDFRTKQEYIENFFNKESFHTVTSFLAANAKLCLNVAKGRYLLISTNFRSESQILKIINPSIAIAGTSHTFLGGKIKERMPLHGDLPRLYKLLTRVQDSIDRVPKRILELKGNRRYIDYYPKLCKEKMRMLNFLFYRNINFDHDLEFKIGKTWIIQVPFLISKTKLSKEKARDHISKIIGKKLLPKEKLVILSGESNDGSFKKRIAEVLKFAKKNPSVHIITPLKIEDKRISTLTLTSNAHFIGFRKDWQEIIQGADAMIIRGSWGEIRDLIFSECVPIVTSLSSVPFDANLDNTQFLTQVSEERACNISLLIQTLQKLNVSNDTLDRLLVDFNDDQSYSINDAISFALHDDIASEIKKALSKIPRSNFEWMGKIHEFILSRKSFSTVTLKKLHADMWGK